MGLFWVKEDAPTPLIGADQGDFGVARIADGLLTKKGDLPGKQVISERAPSGWTSLTLPAECVNPRGAAISKLHKNSFWKITARWRFITGSGKPVFLETRHSTAAAVGC